MAKLERRFLQHLWKLEMTLTPEQLAKLAGYDFIVLADASFSMRTDDVKGRTRWDSMQETLEGFSRDLIKLDEDGIGLVIFNGTEIKVQDGVTVEKLREAFAAARPNSSTPLYEALVEGLKLAGKSDKKDFIIVFTDGVPDNKDAVKKLIIDTANKQVNDDDLTILFIQVGSDSEATAYLKSLDDDLKAQGAQHDIVDVKTVTEAEAFNSTAELIVAAIND